MCVCVLPLCRALSYSSDGMFIVHSGGKSGKDAAEDRDQLDLDSIIGRLLEVCLSRLRVYHSFDTFLVSSGWQCPHG